QNVYFHRLIQQSCHRIEMDCPMGQVDVPYHVSECRYQCLMAPVAYRIDIVTPGINNLGYSTEVAPVSGIHGKTFNFKPVVFSFGKRCKPTAWDAHLVPPKGFRCRDGLATLQLHQHTL